MLIRHHTKVGLFCSAPLVVAIMYFHPLSNHISCFPISRCPHVFPFLCPLVMSENKNPVIRFLAVSRLFGSWPFWLFMDLRAPRNGGLSVAPQRVEICLMPRSKNNKRKEQGRARALVLDNEENVIY